MLHLLLDRYESSLLYEDKNKVNISIAVPLNKRTMPEYFDVTSTAYDTIHEQLREMEDKGYLNLEWGKRKKHILEKCILNVENADAIYKSLHRTPKKVKIQQFLQVCSEFQNEYPAEICIIFLKWIESRINAGKSVKEYVDLDNLEDFRRLIKVLYAIETNAEDMFLRQFSIRVFHDSKIAEQEIRKACGILAMVHIDAEVNITEDAPAESEYIADMAIDEILAEHHIFRNPSWVMMKGNAVFAIETLNNDVNEINLQGFPGGIGISNEDIGKLCWSKEIKPEYVITIENLTSFHQWNSIDGGLCIYLGGYANTARKKMLQDLYQVYTNVPFYHFGDIDCGGFLIWKNLCESTGIPFVTKKMDLQTYEEYIEYGRELTIRDKKQLAQMMEDSFFEEKCELFQEMLVKGRKLEQECISDEGE